ncbi:MAG: PaaI family thioesterase [Paracoccaceae bacterium]
MSKRIRPEPVHVVQKRRDEALSALVDSVPYIRFLGVTFDRRGDELTGHLHYSDKLIGNPLLPALHGGVTSAFLEITSIITLGWSGLWPKIETGSLTSDELANGGLPSLPKTIDFTVDYLRSGLPRDAYARATVSRAGRRYASVHVEAWQDHKTKLFVQATGHFLMPESTLAPSNG